MKKRLIKKAEENKFEDIPKRKIGYSIINVFEETVEQAILNSDRAEDIIYESLYLDKNELIRLNDYIKLFLDYNGAEELFNNVKEFYGLTDTFNEDIKLEIESIVRNFDNYTTADLVAEGDKAVKSAEDYLEAMNND
jgi:hemerythrin superfamily protein